MINLKIHEFRSTNWEELSFVNQFKKNYLELVPFLKTSSNLLYYNNIINFRKAILQFRIIVAPLASRDDDLYWITMVIIGLPDIPRAILESLLRERASMSRRLKRHSPAIQDIAQYLLRAHQENKMANQKGDPLV